MNPLPPQKRETPIEKRRRLEAENMAFNESGQTYALDQRQEAFYRDVGPQANGRYAQLGGYVNGNTAFNAAGEEMQYIPDENGGKWLKTGRTKEGIDKLSDERYRGNVFEDRTGMDYTPYGYMVNGKHYATIQEAKVAQGEEGGYTPTSIRRRATHESDPTVIPASGGITEAQDFFKNYDYSNTPYNGMILNERYPNIRIPDTRQINNWLEGVQARNAAKRQQRQTDRFQRRQTRKIERAGRIKKRKDANDAYKEEVERNAVPSDIVGPYSR
jgi:hypothetical protein